MLRDVMTWVSAGADGPRPAVGAGAGQRGDRTHRARDARRPARPDAQGGAHHESCGRGPERPAHRHCENRAPLLPLCW